MHGDFLEILDDDIKQQCINPYNIQKHLRKVICIDNMFICSISVHLYECYLSILRHGSIPPHETHISEEYELCKKQSKQWIAYCQP